MPYCESCNTQWADTGCGQDRDHKRCPEPCGMCALPITGRDNPGDCPSHTIAELRDFVDRLRIRG